MKDAAQYSLNTSEMVSGPTTLAKRLIKVEKLNDEFAYMLVKKEYKNFLSSMIDDPAFDKVKISSKFINALIQVCIECELTYEERIYCNSMIYKQLPKLSNIYLRKIYYILGLVVNKTIVTKIMDECHLDQILSSYLAVIRKSSFSKKENVARLNFSIMCLDPNLMTAQRITDLYCAVYNNSEDIKELFLNIVTDVYVYNSDEDWITDDILKTAKNMEIAILSILDSLDMNSIENILLEYSRIVMLNDLDTDEVRISFNKIDRNSFKNISIILNEFERKNIILP